MTKEASPLVVANINPGDNHYIHETRDSIDDDLDELIARMKRNKAASLALQAEKEAQIALHSSPTRKG